MYRPRVIPILLLKGQGLVKSIRFKDYRYIGDPINAVKIFNDLKADELVFLDILASKEKRLISLDFVRNVGDEANMPFAVGGGIRNIQQIKELINSGAEKVIINTYAVESSEFIKQASDEFGSSTIVVSIDVKKKFFGKKQVYTMSGTKATGLNPIDFAKLMQEKGAGELIINSIENDGLMSGYDLDLIKQISEAVDIPIVAAGGPGVLGDLSKAVNDSYASAVAAGSMFVYHGPRRGVLINYPTNNELLKLFDK
jgi:imidazole glycerol-phosphate synthase subunit HisF